MEPIRWTVAGDPVQVRDIVGHQLESLGYSVEIDPTGWAGNAEVGSKVARAFAGGFVRRMKVTFNVEQGISQDQVVATVNPDSTGWSGGALGASKAKKEMTSIHESVSAGLAAAQLPAAVS